MHVDVFAKAAEMKRSGAEFVLVTVAGFEGSSPGHSGAKMIVTSTESIGTVGGGTLERMSIDLARRLLVERRCALDTFDLGGSDSSATPTGMICGGSATLFFEYFPPAERAYIWGGGHIGKSLRENLLQVGFDVTIIDDRPAIIDSMSGAAILSEFDAFDEPIREDAFHIIATYGHEHDYVVLKKIFASNWAPRYVGLVSSIKKREVLIERLISELSKPLNLDLLFTPAGLDIGGETPDEIALSIASEVQAVRYGKTGLKHLRDR